MRVNGLVTTRSYHNIQTHEARIKAAQQYLDAQKDIEA